MPGTLLTATGDDARTPDTEYRGVREYCWERLTADLRRRHRTHASVSTAHCRPLANGFHLGVTNVSVTCAQDCTSDSTLCDRATSDSDSPLGLHTQLRSSPTRHVRRDFTLGIIEPTQATKVINFPRTACTPVTPTLPCGRVALSLQPLTSEYDIALTQTSSELTADHSPMDLTSVRRMYQLLMHRTALLTPHRATARPAAAALPSVMLLWNEVDPARSAVLFYTLSPRHTSWQTG